jgi:hypothetical protein
VLETLSRLIPALVRHLLAYGELLSDEAADAARELRRRLLAAFIVMFAGAVATLMGCTWVIAATWDSPHRLQAVGALCIGFAAIALAGVWYANAGARRERPRPFERLAAEWREDLRQLVALYPSLAGIEQSRAGASDLHVD